MTENRFRRSTAPRAAISIVAVTTVVTILQLTGAFNDFVDENFVLNHPAVWAGEYWRILSVGLVHGDFVHLLFNMLALWNMGIIYELNTSSRWMLVVYTISVALGSALVLIFGDALIGAVGASGGVFGVFGALLGMLHARMGGIRNIWHLPFGRSLLILLAINVAISFAPGISLLGHLGGLIAGGLLGYADELRRRGRLAPAEGASIALLWLGIVACVAYAARPTLRGAYQVIDAADNVGFELRREPGTYAWRVADTQKLTLENLQESRDRMRRADEDRFTSPEHWAFLRRSAEMIEAALADIESSGEYIDRSRRRKDPAPPSNGGESR